VSYPPINLTL